MRFCIMDIETGVCVAVTEFVVKAAEALRPGTVYGTGETSQLAWQRARDRREQARALPLSWRMPPELAAKLAAIKVNRRAGQEVKI